MRNASQWLERRVTVPKVAGSIPVSALRCSSESLNACSLVIFLFFHSQKLCTTASLLNAQIVPPHHTDEHRGSARGEPKRLDATPVECGEKTPGTIDVGKAVREMVAVVHLLQLRHLVVILIMDSPAAIDVVHSLRQQLNVGLQLCEQLLLRDATYGFVGWVEGQRLQVVQFTEHGELGELRDDGQEDEPQILSLGLQRAEQAADMPADIFLNQ